MVKNYKEVLYDNYSMLIKSICEINEVLSIGKCGGEELPEKNESDIDVFVLCSKIPDARTRKIAINKSGIAVSMIFG
ncbi:MAG: hypothetical protein FWC47_11445 [Oscillospiraceae bacterium]|nr:hypothetical protein [Oscillospiraceae bacterium]